MKKSDLLAEIQSLKQQLARLQGELDAYKQLQPFNPIYYHPPYFAPMPTYPLPPYTITCDSPNTATISFS